MLHSSDTFCNTWKFFSGYKEYVPISYNGTSYEFYTTYWLHYSSTLQDMLVQNGYQIEKNPILCGW